MSTHKERAEKSARLEQANEFIRLIASCGRQFFHHEGCVSQLEIDARGRVWLRDKYSGKLVYTHYEQGRWRGFSEGGTLRALIIALRRYVCHSTPVPRWFFGEGCYDGNRWGYDAESMGRVRTAAEAFAPGSRQLR